MREGEKTKKLMAIGLVLVLLIAGTIYAVSASHFGSPPRATLHPSSIDPDYVALPTETVPANDNAPHIVCTPGGPGPCG